MTTYYIEKAGLIVKTAKDKAKAEALIAAGKGLKLAKGGQAELRERHAVEKANAAEKPGQQHQEREAAGAKARDAETASPKTAGKPKKSVRPVKAVATAKPVKGKTDEVVRLLQRKQGVTVAEIMTVTGWLPHTTRARLTGLRQGGYAIERGKEGGDTFYRMSAQ